MTDHNIDPTRPDTVGQSEARANAQPRRSPRAVRTAAFNRRMRGYDENEVREFLASLGDEIEVADAERTALRAEIERLRHERRPTDPTSTAGGAVVDPQSVALFSQAQQVADRVVAEAVEHAKEMMANAREQQRDILKKAHSAAELAEAKAAAAESVSAQDQPAGRSGTSPGDLAYDRPVAEIEYVRTFARVAQVQLKSVLDALTDQVEKLGELPDMSDAGAARDTSEPRGLAADRGVPGAHQELTDSGERHLRIGEPARLERRSRSGQEPFGAGAGLGPGAGPTDRPNPPWP